MARLAQRRALDFWPGFVDALASLLMVLIFVILIFALGQFVLTDAVSGRDRALSRLNAELASLASSLSLEQSARAQADSRIGELSASLSDSEGERQALADELFAARGELHAAQDEASTQREHSARLSADINALERLKAELEAEIARQASALDSSEHSLKEQSALAEQSIAQIELLNRQLAAVREQLETLNQTLAAAEAQIEEKDLKLEELGRELNLALVKEVKELARYRSEFFGRLSTVLGQRKDIRIVDDRFVFASEVLFASASDEVSADGLIQLSRLAETLIALAHEIPPELPWVLQVDGHTDRRPIATERFPSNWELSTARALAIVKFLHSQGVPAQRLAATGYGEFHPVDPANNERGWARNRRIELKLTNR